MLKCQHSNKILFADFGGEKIHECRECSLVFTPQLISVFDPSVLYSDYYRNETGLSVGKFRPGVETVVKIFRLFRAFKIYTLNSTGKSILDIGCGRGWTLYFLKKYFGFNRVVGTQISQPAFEYARDRLSLEVYDKDLLDLSMNKQTFDVVTMWHVLEHVKYPEAYLEKIYELLKQGGYFVVEVPNLQSWTRKLSGKYWMGYDLKYHLSFFSEKNLSALLIRHGFEIKKIRTFSLEYSTYISAQSLLSRWTDTDQILFSSIQGKSVPLFKLLFHVFCMAVLVPFCFVINVALYFSKRGEVLLILAQKK